MTCKCAWRCWEEYSECSEDWETEEELVQRCLTRTRQIMEEE